MKKGLFILLLVMAAAMPANAGDPGAAYLLDGSNTIWFIQIADTHIDNILADFEEENLQWVFTDAVENINPYFMVNTGDLTDSTTANIPYYGSGPHEEEWEKYRAFIDDAGFAPEL